MTNILIAIIFVVAMALIISVLCIKQKYKDQKACLFVDLFTVGAAGASLVISSTVLYQTTNITNTVTNIYESKSEVVGYPVTLDAQVKLNCVNLGDGVGLECRWIPGEIEFTNN